MATPEHPNLPKKGVLGFTFVGIVIAGILGGLIGYGLVRTSCSDTPTRAERLLEQLPNFHASVTSCVWPAFFAALIGTIMCAGGAGIVATLLLRAQSEWRSHAPPPGRAL